MKYRFLVCWGLFVLGVMLSDAKAQEILRLLEYTKVWKYEQPGTDLGSDWKEMGYDDSAWPAGAGLLGIEPTLPAPYPVPLNTGLSLGNPATITY